MEEAGSNVSKMRKFLDVAYSDDDSENKKVQLEEMIRAEFPPNVQNALRLLPAEYISPGPLHGLLDGFETDLQFQDDDDASPKTRTWPIADEDDLERYATCVAGTVAELCLDLVFHHASEQYSSLDRSRLKLAGRKMGIALQLINIARDIGVDARLGRVYLPQTWLKEVGLTPEDVLRCQDTFQVQSLRNRLLCRAEEMYRQARPAIEELPSNGRRPMRVAVESYVEIGRVLRSRTYRAKAGRATVPRLRRLCVAWRALSQP